MTEKPGSNLQETLMRIEAEKRQLEALVSQSRVIESAIVELANTIELLEQLKKTPNGTEILAPIGGECFVKATLKDNSSVLVGIGAKVSVEKNVDEAVKILKDKSDELSKTLVKARENCVAINDHIEEMGETAQKMFQEAQSKK